MWPADNARRQRQVSTMERDACEKIAEKKHRRLGSQAQDRWYEQ